MSLIDWDDPNDPLSRVVVPEPQELEEWGQLDPSKEEDYRIMPGLEHKYDPTVLLLVSNTCDSICRYCFRKRVFFDSSGNDKLKDIPAAMRYISQQKQITNVLLTGGAPLVLSTAKLENIIRKLRQIDHVKIIRIGTRIPAFNPHRIIDDPVLLEMIKKYSVSEKRIYIVTHFVHWRELTNVAIETIDLLIKAGAVIMNQTPILKGINDDPEVLAKLFGRLSFVGAAPYYAFQCRPALGNRAFTVPIERAYDIVEQAKAKIFSLAKRVRYVISHSTGKIEIVAKTGGMVYFKYHETPNQEDNGKVLAFKSNPDACWFDDYKQVNDLHSNSLRYDLLELK